jgi:hypothetical protein
LGNSAAAERDVDEIESGGIAERIDFLLHDRRRRSAIRIYGTACKNYYAPTLLLMALVNIHVVYPERFDVV